MQSVDRRAIEEFGIPSLVLMENAALGVVDAIGAEFPGAHSVAVFCGPGNNGGDGLAIGRHLAVRGYAVTIFVAAGGRELRGDAAIQLGICRGMGLDLREIQPEEVIAGAVESAAASDVVVDALFGTGLGRPLEGRIADLISALNEVPRPRVAVDLPSGLSGDSPDVFGPVLEADLTVTFAAPKIPHVFLPAAALTGRVVIADLGIPPELLERAPGDLHLSTESDLAPLMTARAVDSHKGDYGHVLVVGGSEGKSGAVILAAKAAARCGAGLVTVACPATIVATVESCSIETMAIALPLRGPGLGRDCLLALETASRGKDVLAVGPGLGLSGETPEIVRELVLRTKKPVVLDADGLNAFAGRLEALGERRSETVLTPHPGELARLLGITVGEVLEDRAAAVRRGCDECRAVLVLKGHHSLVGDPLGGIYVNPTGNPGMATGGSGDVLTGIIAGLIGQGTGPFEAARLGVFLHGLAGDLAVERSGEAGLVAGDLLGRLPEAIERLVSS
jgi:NAD(P)H-hydrate epimerase